MAKLYYKIVKDGNIVGAVSDDSFRKYQPKHNMVVFSDPNHAQYMEYQGTLFRSSWLKPLDDEMLSDIPYTYADIMPIEENEYNSLTEALELADEIPTENPEISEEVPPVSSHESETEESDDDPISIVEFLKIITGVDNG